MEIIAGGVCAPKGFKAAGVHAGVRKNPDKKDLALIYSEKPCVAGGVTTQNITCAAPVKVTREHLKSDFVHGIICNSGNANACAEGGMKAAMEMCSLAAKELGVSPEEILVGSTGVIGVPLDVGPIKKAMSSLVESLSDNGSDSCAHAIMTTDTAKKETAVQLNIEGSGVVIGGISKGSGMIHPNMATMLGFVTTDADISKEMLQKAVSDATKLTFNMVSVDGDTSTNDMVFVLANGEAGNPIINSEGDSYSSFYNGLLAVFKTLAIAIASDGEGASKLLTCNVSGGADAESAKVLAKSVIGSSLVKTAMFGRDANWGRILCAMGYSGADFDPEKVDVSFVSPLGEVQVCKAGLNQDFSEELAKEVLSADSIDINISLGQGDKSATAWGCDLTYEYVKINGEYRS